MALRFPNSPLRGSVISSQVGFILLGFVGRESPARGSLRIGMIVAFIAVLTIPALAQQRIEVGPNVAVSSLHPDWEHNEVILAADPNDTKHLLAGSMFLDPSKAGYSVVTYVSLDGGKSWTPTLVVGRERGHYGDPAIAFGCDGSAYSVSLKGEGPRSECQTLVHRSVDGGKNWLPPTILPFIDREYISVDCTNSKYRGRIYIHGNRVMQATDGNRISGTEIFVSEDNGKSFSEAIFTHATNHVSTYQGNGVVLSDGTYIAPFTDLEKHGSQPPLLRVIRSVDGGKSFSKAITVSQRSEEQSLPSFAVDRSGGPFRDRIYAVWSEGRFGRSHILLVYSADKGTTWSVPIIVNDDQPFSDGRKEPDGFMGTVAVNREGIVGVTWYDRRESANGRDWYVRFAASCDGGKSFIPSVKVSEAAFTHDSKKVRALGIDTSPSENNESNKNDLLTVHVTPDRSYQGGGDTAGLATSLDGRFHALWIDNRSGVSQVWTAPISISGIATSDKGGEFSGLRVITQKVKFQFSEPQYDPLTKTISAKADLVNISEESLMGPIVVRVESIEPKEVEILEADNRELREGAVWKFTSVLKDHRLKPGEKTESKLLRFRFKKKGLEGSAVGEFRGPYMDFSIRAFAKP